MTAGALKATEFKSDGIAQVLAFYRATAPSFAEPASRIRWPRSSTPKARSRPSRSSRCAVASIARANAVNAIVVLVKSSTRRRGHWSATTPAKGESNSTGIARAAPRIPRSSAARCGEPAMRATKNPIAVNCIHVPKLETSRPIQSRRKSRKRSGARIDSDDRTALSHRLCVRTAATIARRAFRRQSRRVERTDRTCRTSPKLAPYQSLDDPSRMRSIRSTSGFGGASLGTERARDPARFATRAVHA